MSLINPQRYWQQLMELGGITEPDRPYTRRSFSPLFLEGRAWLRTQMQAAGLNWAALCWVHTVIRCHLAAVSTVLPE